MLILDRIAHIPLPHAREGRRRGCPAGRGMAARHAFLPALFQPDPRYHVNARHSPHYEITAEEYAWSFERIEVLDRIVAEICAERRGGLPDLTGDAASSPFPSA